MEFNLIVIHEPGLDNYSWARNQVRQVLGFDAVLVDAYQSVLLYKYKGDPHEGAAKLREALKGSGTPIIKAIPVDAITDPLIDKVVEAVKELVPRIPEGAKFRITLEGHLYDIGERGLRRLHWYDAVKEVAEYIDRPVDLENPEYVLYIKVVRWRRVTRKAAITVAKPEEVTRIQ